MAERVLVECSFGNLRLWVADLETEGGRSVVVHEPARGDVYTVQDHGAQLSRTRAELVFVDIPGEDPYLDRFAAWQALLASGKSQLFSHPLLGSFRAKAGACPFVIRSDARDVRVHAEFLPDEELAGVTAPGAGVAPIAGAESVEVAAESALGYLALLELESDTPAAATAAAAGWVEAEEPDPRAVFLELGSITRQIDDDVARLQLATDLGRWPAYRAMILLRANLRDCALGVTAATASTFGLVIRAAVPLRALCARIYGADEAEERARQVRQTNGLRSPALLPAGLTLQMPTPARRGS
ncbi:MAG: DNA circularization N-terminal domain-containing protein [Myxococcales bacterium]|nr:DNA circularization N-terminal domain-containing protein [Myxococcales bacterium]